MQRKLLIRAYASILILFCFTALAWGQSDKRVVLNTGLLIFEDHSIVVGAQVKHYVINDTALSNYGPGAGCEFNFAFNSAKLTIGPKIYYQFDKHLLDFGYHKTGLFVAGRLSLICYVNSESSNLRIAPEVGFSLEDVFALFYGYNFGYNNNFPVLAGSRVTMLLTFFGKERNKGNKEPLPPLH